MIYEFFMLKIDVPNTSPMLSWQNLVFPISQVTCFNCTLVHSNFLHSLAFNVMERSSRNLMRRSSCISKIACIMGFSLSRHTPNHSFKCMTTTVEEFAVYGTVHLVERGKQKYLKNQMRSLSHHILKESINALTSIQH